MQDPIHITATVMQGALLALTPLAILFSAFVFFNALQVTQAGWRAGVSRTGSACALPRRLALLPLHLE